MPQPTGLQSSADELRDQLPRPILPARPGWVQLYWRAWELAARAVQHGTLANGFAPLYIGSSRSGNIVQWETCMVAPFVRYSAELLPALPALDNFYRRQDHDGFIAREYRWESGAGLWARFSADASHPPLFAWAEWLLFQVHGRHARLLAVWPHLERYYRWLCTHRQLPSGLYWASAGGAAMASAPRAGAAWCDYSLQQALNALSMACIAAALGDEEGARAYQHAHTNLAGLINLLMWDEATGCYCDLDAAEQPLPGSTLAPFWALLAEVAPPERAAHLVCQLQDPALFWRAHPFPLIAADTQDAATDDLWPGAVWPALNYVVISGLSAAGYTTLARTATTRHLDAMLNVYQQTNTFWERYHPDEPGPGLPACPDRVGTGGLGPIALLIEQIIGIELDADASTIGWYIAEDGDHGIENLPFLGDRVSLLLDDSGSLTVQCGRPFRLLLSGQQSATIDVPSGGGMFNL